MADAISAEKTLALDARGMTARDIQAHMAESYGVDVSPSLNSSPRELLQYRGHFAGDQPVTETLCLRLRRLQDKWTRAPWNWSAVIGQLTNFFQRSRPPL